MDKKHSIRTHSGFTLVELALVLVILALLIGGVLVGQSLMKSAELRRFVTGVGELNVAATAFKVKYMGLPGDLANGVAFFGATDANGFTTTNGNGDGKVNEICGRGVVAPGCDIQLKDNNYEAGFFQQLALAGLISGVYNPSATGPGTQFPSISKGSITTQVGSAGIIAFSGEGKHYWLTGIVDSSLAQYAPWGATSYSLGPGMFTPLEAFNISTKIGDGTPTGKVMSAFGESSTFTGGPIATYWLHTTGAAYASCYLSCADHANNVWCTNPSVNTISNERICNLRIQAGF